MTKTTQLMQAIRQQIATGQVLPGDRLPSIRGLAAKRGISPSTVVEAYDRLVAEGVIHARPGSGFYAAGHAPMRLPGDPPPGRDRDIDPLWVSRQALDAGPQILRPGCGWMPPDWLPQPALRRALRQISRQGDGMLADYGSSRGAPALRRMLARQACDEGLQASPDMVLLTGSGSQATDLICRLLLRPGDTVLLDDPCYFNFQALLRVHGVRVVSVPFTPDGPDLAAFAAALQAHRPRLYLTNSALHNPTGATISARSAHHLLVLAARHDLTIIEDDTFAALEPDPSPRLAVLDGLARVIRTGSFSKTLSASVRCGYVIARPDVIEALTDLQVATNFGGPSPISAEVVHTTLLDGSYRKHVEAVRTRLARARRDVTTRLADLGIRPWVQPRGGFYLWCELPEGTDAAPLARQALLGQVVLAPGPVFSPSGGAGAFMRFNVTQMHPPVYDMLRRAI